MPDDTALILVKVRRHQVPTINLLKRRAGPSHGLGSVSQLTAWGAMRQAPFAPGALALATHQAMVARGASKTCIDCHKGIAHQLPEHDKDPNE
jgi:hypothetical protein